MHLKHMVRSLPRPVAISLGLVTTLVLSTGLSPAAASGDFSVIATVNVGLNPFGNTVAPNGRFVWVANSGDDTVSVIDTHTLAVTATLPVGDFPEDIAFTSDGRQAFVTNSSSATVSVFDAQHQTVTQTVDLNPIPMSFPFGVAVDQSDTHVWVTSAGADFDNSDENIAILDNHNNANVQVSQTIDVAGFTGRPALTPDGKRFLVPRAVDYLGPAEMLWINATTGVIENSLLFDSSLIQNFAGDAGDVAITPNGRFAYAALFGDNGGVWIIDVKAGTTVGVVPLGTPVEGVAATPDGRFVFATGFGNGTVSVISTQTNHVVATLAVGSLPNEVSVTPDSTLAFVTNQGGSTVSVIAIPDQ